MKLPGAFDGGEPPLRILGLLPILNHYGGVISILNMFEEFLELGHHCVLASLSKYAQEDLVTRFAPIWLAAPDRAANLFADEVFDLVVASSWETVAPARAIAEATGALPVYFVQDIEADFVKGIDEEKYRTALETYSLIDTRIVKTRHLQQRLAALGFEAQVITPGMNLNIFYPRAQERDGSFRVLAMARPNAPNGQRGFPLLVEAFARLTADHPDLRVGFFGDDGLAKLGLPFAYEDFGVVGSKSLPGIYSWADLYVDASRFHGFGRTGVEAMACGAVCVLTQSGGVSDYCRHEENGLLVPIDDPAALIQAVERLKADAALRDTLRQNAFLTVRGFDDRTAAREFLAVCLAALDRQALPAASAAD